MKSKTSEIFDDCKSVHLRSVPTELRDSLRLATADVHERLHRHIGFAAVQAGSIDHRAYIKLLSRLYGFYRPFEAAAQLSPERTRWLEAVEVTVKRDLVSRFRLLVIDPRVRHMEQQRPVTHAR